MTRRSVVIVGGGIAGLSAAWELTGASNGPTSDTPRIEILDASERFGGALETTTFAGRTIDLGADGFLARRPEVTTLAKELGLEDQLVPIAASGASLFLHGALRELPTGLALGVPTNWQQIKGMSGLSRKARRAAKRDWRRPRRFEVGDDASIGAIVRAKLGDELATQFIEPMIGGIQAGRIDELSARAVFPALLEAAKAGGSLMKALAPTGPVSPGAANTTAASGPVFASLRDGVGSLTSELVKQLRERGVIFRSETPVTALRKSGVTDYTWEVESTTTTVQANYVILTTPIAHVASLTAHLDPALAALGTIPSAGAAIVSFVASSADVTLPEHGTGILVPLNTPWRDGSSMMITAITFLDRKWPHLKRDGEVFLRAHVGRSDDTRWHDMDDATLTARVHEELTTLLTGWGGVLDSRVQRWTPGLPQYLVGHEARIDAAMMAAQTRALALAGSAYRGVGIPASIASGRRAGRAALAQYS